jgi:hypothetical protein
MPLERSVGAVLKRSAAPPCTPASAPSSSRSRQRLRAAPARAVDREVEPADAPRQCRAALGPRQAQRDVGLASGQAEIARLGDELDAQPRMAREQARQGRDQQAVRQDRHRGDAHAPGDNGAADAAREREKFLLDAGGAGGRRRARSAGRSSPCAGAVADLYRADPFWPTGLRKAVRVLRWSQVFADGRRLV